MSALPIGLQRLVQLAEHLEHGRLGHEKFDFSTYNDTNENACGTAGCALGECPILFPSEWHFYNYGTPLLIDGQLCYCTESAIRFFDISRREAQHLFYPIGQDCDSLGGNQLDYDATKEEVAQNIRAFVAIKAQALEAQTNA